MSIIQIFYRFIFSFLFLFEACTRTGEKPKSIPEPNQKPLVKSWSCPDTGLFAFAPAPPILKQGDTWGIQPKRGDSAEDDKGGYEIVYWIGDLNSDGIQDYITAEGLNGFTKFSVFVGCGSSRYYQVLYGAADHVGVEPPSVGTSPWSLLRIEFWPFRQDYGEYNFYRWNGGQYGLCCKIQVPVDSTKNHIHHCCQ